MPQTPILGMGYTAPLQTLPLPQTLILGLVYTASLQTLPSTLQSETATFASHYPNAIVSCML